MWDWSARMLSCWMEQGCCWESVYIQMVLVDVTRMHIPFMTPDEALNSVSHAPVINFLAPNLVGILFRVCELLHELWRPECSFVETAAQELGGHNSDYVSHNSLSLFSPVSSRDCYSTSIYATPWGWKLNNSAKIRKIASVILKMTMVVLLYLNTIPKC